jgi:all-trans-retinol 13,14-reductase
VAEPEVIVGGKEIGSLAAALTGARGGRDVLVLEAAGQFAPFIGPFSPKRTWFDTAIHYVGGRGPGQLPHARCEAVGLLEDLQSRDLAPDDLEPTT